MILQASTTTNQTHAVSTWPPHSQDPVTSLDRPHTISTAYEKGHQRPPLTVYTFQNPDGSTSTEQQPVQKSPANVACRPPLPVVSQPRCHFSFQLFFAFFLLLVEEIKQKQCVINYYNGIKEHNVIFCKFFLNKSITSKNSDLERFSFSNFKREIPRWRIVAEFIEKLVSQLGLMTFVSHVAFDRVFYRTLF